MQTVVGKMKVTNFHLTDKPVLTARCTLPGFSFTYLDRHGNYRMDDLTKYGILARHHLVNRPFNNKTFMDYNEATRSGLVFTSSIHIDISPDLHNRDVDKSTIDAAVQHGYVGNSSETSRFLLFLPGDTKNPLYQAETGCILVDPATRKPKPFPNWFKEKYRKGGFTDKPLILKPFERPPVTFINKIKTMWLETDANNHVAFPAFIAYSTNAIHAAIKDKKTAAMRGLTEEIILNGLKNLQIVNFQECLEGDHLDIHVWQDAADKHVVYCSAEKGSKKIAQIKFSYYDTCQHDKKYFKLS
ncbi:uncharacterized protein LOC131954484 isoform X2 [Physella acuta]|nr:uncharacterized protein LOC131954484 isoform X2 [Physella acuta]